MREEIAILAGGCFWCMVQPFDQWPGIISVTSGYTGGLSKNPTYEEVKKGITGHTEAVKIVFNPKEISYERILDIFWSIIDPTDLEGQFVDRGSSYRPEIFYTTDEQKLIAEQSKKELQASNRFSKPIVVPITQAQQFYEAEEYHQNFYKKNPDHYHRYKSLSGREAFIQAHQKIND